MEQEMVLVVLAGVQYRLGQPGEIGSQPLGAHDCRELNREFNMVVTVVISQIGS